MAKSTKAPKKGSKAATKEILIVGSEVKDDVKAARCVSSGRRIERLSNQSHALLASAAAPPPASSCTLSAPTAPRLLPQRRPSPARAAAAVRHVNAIAASALVTMVSLRSARPAAPDGPIVSLRSAPLAAPDGPMAV